MRISGALLILSLICTATAEAQTAADSAAIRETVLDYVDGWWTGNVEQMERSLHPDLVKRRVGTHRGTGRNLLFSDTKTALVESTRGGGGSSNIAQKGTIEVQLLALGAGIANVVATSARYVDYLHLVKWDGRWVILNVLWAERALGSGS